MYDDISAYYSIASAKEPYEKKYGSAPKLKFNAYSKSSLYTIGNGDKRVVRRFGKQRKVVSENHQVDNTDAIATEKNNDTQTNSVEIPYQQKFGSVIILRRIKKSDDGWQNKECFCI